MRSLPLRSELQNRAVHGDLGTMAAWDVMLVKRGLVTKIPRSRRWCVTDLGYKLMSAAIRLQEQWVS